MRDLGRVRVRQLRPGTLKASRAFSATCGDAFASYRMEDMVCTRRKEYEVACNWKIYVENAMEAFHVPHVHRGSINRQRGSVENDRTFDSTEGNWVVMHKEHEGSRAMLVGDKGFPRIAGLKGKADARARIYPLIFPSTMLGCTIDCMWFLEIHPLSATTMRLDRRLVLPESGHAAARLRGDRRELLQALGHDDAGGHRHQRDPAAGRVDAALAGPGGSPSTSRSCTRSTTGCSTTCSASRRRTAASRASCAAGPRRAA